MGKHKRKGRATKTTKSGMGSGPKKPTPANPSSIGRIRGTLIVLLGLFVLIIIMKSPVIDLLKDNLGMQQNKVVEMTQNRAPFPPASGNIKRNEPLFTDFVGSRACAECHQEQYALWKNSTHGRAGGAPNEKNLISQFNGNPLRFQDAVVRPTSLNNKYQFIVEAEGFAKQILGLDAVVGGGHLTGGGTQSYFSRYPDGTLRFLPFDFVRKESVWFCQRRKNNEWAPIDEDMSLSDLLQWPPTRILGTETGFSNCQNCHGSQIEVAFDPDKKQYVTKFTSLAINCESCHGPGKRHVTLARSGNIADSTEIGMAALSTLNKTESLLICFQCHATKDPIQNNYLPGKELEQYYSLKLPILGDNPYLVDGRVRGFAYQQNHLYSDCYLSGSMVCVDCHEPHSQTYRDINSKPLRGKFDNGQCLGCHASKMERPEAHSHHKPDSAGNLCTSCHMPYLQHKAIGTQLRFARSDHTIPIPRPEFDTQLGIENACKKCHEEKTVAWLQTKTAEWYGELKPHKNLVSGLLEARDIADRVTAVRRLLADSLQHPVAQMAGLSYFARTFLTPNMPSLEPEIVDRLKDLSQSLDLDIKSMALMSLHLAYDQNVKTHNYLISRLRGLGDEEGAVRSRWAIAIDFMGSFYASKGDLDGAIICHKKALEIKPDDPVAMTNLGIAYAQKGEIENGIAALQQAIRNDPQYMTAHLNLATVYLRRGDLGIAISAMNRALDIKPVDAAAHFFLANLFVKKGNKPRAIQSLEEGLKYAPNDLEARLILKNLKAN